MRQADGELIASFSRIAGRAHPAGANAHASAPSHNSRTTRSIFARLSICWFVILRSKISDDETPRKNSFLSLSAFSEFNSASRRMSLTGVVVSVTGNFDRQVLSGAVRKAGGRVDALVHKNLDYVRFCLRGPWGGEKESVIKGPCSRACSCAQSSRAWQKLTCGVSLQLISDDEAVKRNTQRVRKVIAV